MAPGVDHRVERPVAIVDHDGVEGVPRRLDADPFEHRVATLVLERHPEHERLRDRLDGEVEIGVAHLVDVAVGGHHADAEPVRVGPAQLGDVGGDLALFELAVLVEEAVEVVEDGRSGHSAEVEVVERAIEPAVEACHGGHLTRSARTSPFPVRSVPVTDI